MSNQETANLNELLVLLGHHQTGGVGGAEHVDHQLVAEHVQLLHLLALHVRRTGDSVPES